MLQTVRITSKRQITIPAKIFKHLNLNQGDYLSIYIDQGKIIMEKSQKLLDEIAGSIELSKEYKGKSIDFIIRDSKKKYFSRKK